VTPQWRGKWIEKGLFNLIESGDFRAISFYLACVAKDRGYGLPSTSPLGGSATVAISTINILAVPTGQSWGSRRRALDHLLDIPLDDWLRPA
jgi:hypothetical protein